MKLQGAEVDEETRVSWPLSQKNRRRSSALLGSTGRQLHTSEGHMNPSPQSVQSPRQPARYMSEGSTPRDAAKPDRIVQRGSRRISAVLAERTSDIQQGGVTPRRHSTGLTPRRASTLPAIGESLLSRRTSLRSSSKTAQIAEPEVEDAYPNGERRMSMSNPEFAFLVLLSKKHSHPLEDVKKLWDDFSRYSEESKGIMTFAEFEAAVRVRCNLPENEVIPSHLIPETIRMIGLRRGTLNFEVYLQWIISTAFAEEVMVPDRHVRRIRKIARDRGLAIDDVERLKVAFDHFDADSSGFIDQKEFREVLKELIKKKRGATTEPSDVAVARYFKEIDHNSDGMIAFEEFVPWYWNVLES